MRRAVPNRRGGARRPPSPAGRPPARRRRPAVAIAAVLLLALAAPQRSPLADLWSLLLAPWRALTAASESVPAPTAPAPSACPEGATDCTSPPTEEPEPGGERGPSVDPNGLGSGEPVVP